MYSMRVNTTYETCPYNHAHRVLEYRMAGHLVKCRRTVKQEMVMGVCIYNSTHNVPEPELKFHHKTCPNRINLDKHVLIDKKINQNRFPIKNIDVSTEENWDDVDVPTYNPEDYCTANPILRVKNVQSAAVRRNFRVQERNRIQSLQNEQEPGSAPRQPNGACTTKIKSVDTIHENDPYSFEELQKIIMRGGRANHLKRVGSSAPAST